MAGQSLPFTILTQSDVARTQARIEMFFYTHLDAWGREKVSDDFY